MKKLIAILLTSILFLSVSVNVFADGTTTLTTTVPAATYTLNIPADQEIAFGASQSRIGYITVTDSNGFAKGKDIQVTITYEPFSSDTVTTTIPYSLSISENNSYLTLQSGESIYFKGLDTGKVSEKPVASQNGNGSYELGGLDVIISSTSWGKALAGEYSSTITFTSEVVSSGN